MMNRLAQFVQDCLPAARLGGGTPLGTALSLTFSGVACVPVLTALTEDKRTLFHQGLRKSGGLRTLDDNPSAPPHNPSASQTAGKIFFRYRLNPLNLIVFYQRSESLTPHSLHQIDDAYLQSLEVEALRGLSMRLLADLKEAWDRLNQGPDNSSRPPSSRAPWERPRGARAAAADAAAAAAEGDREPEPAERNPEEPTVVVPPAAEAKPASAP